MNSSPNLGHACGFYKLYIAEIIFANSDKMFFFLADGREDNFVHVSEALMAGIVAGAAESLISSPFELFKLREQVKSASRIPTSSSVTEKGTGSPLIARLLYGFSPDKRALNQSVSLLSTLATKHPNMMGALQEYPWMITGSGRPPSVCDVRRPLDVISLEGWSALWRGIRSGVVRDSIFSGIFFSSWQFLHRAMLDWKAVGMDPLPRFKIHPSVICVLRFNSRALLCMCSLLALSYESYSSLVSCHCFYYLIGEQIV